MMAADPCPFSVENLWKTDPSPYNWVLWRREN